MNAALRAAFIAELEQKPEFHIIHTLLQQPDATPEAVVEAITKRTISEVDNEQSTHYYDTACSVVEVAHRTAPEQQDKLCEFVMSLIKQSLNHPKTGHPLEVWQSKVWTELPGFGFTFADELQHILLNGDLGGYSKKSTKDAYRDENLEAFAARLTGYPSDRKPDFAYHGQIVLSDAFYLDAQIPPGRIVPTARLGCWWFIYAATTLWSKVQDPEDDDWSFGLWNIYKEGLRTTKATIRNYEARMLIERAIAQMEMAEQGKRN